MNMVNGYLLALRPTHQTSICLSLEVYVTPVLEANSTPSLITHQTAISKLWTVKPSMPAIGWARRMMTRSVYSTPFPSPLHHRPGGLTASCPALPLTHQTTPHARAHLRRHLLSQLRQLSTPIPPGPLRPRCPPTAGCPKQTLVEQTIQHHDHTHRAHPVGYAVHTKHTWFSVRTQHTSNMFTFLGTGSSEHYLPGPPVIHPTTTKQCV